MRGQSVVAHYELDRVKCTILINHKENKMSDMDRAMRIIKAGKSVATKEGQWRLEEIEINMNGYSEPGYDNPSGLIASGNWNTINKWVDGIPVIKDDTLVRVATLLERLGVDLIWSDEYDSCVECAKVFRTSPDSYGRTRSYVDTEDGRYCHECVSEDPESFLEDFENDPRKAWTLDYEISLEDNGYVKVNEEEYCNGLHHGQTDNPEKIAIALRSQSIERFIFAIDSIGQFDMDFSVYVHESEVSKLNREELDNADIAGPDPEEMFKKAMKSPGMKRSSDGIVYNKIDLSDGSVESRVLSPQEFIEGIGD